MNRVILLVMLGAFLFGSCASPKHEPAPVLTVNQAREALARLSSGSDWRDVKFAADMARRGAVVKLDRHEIQIGPCWTVSLDKRDFSFMASGTGGMVFRSGVFNYANGRWIAKSDAPDYLSEVRADR